MKKAIAHLLLCSLSFLISGFTYAYYTAQESQEFFYGHMSDGNLKDLVQKVASRNHNALGYDTARVYLFGELHLEEDQDGLFVRDIYCGKIFRSKAGVGRHRIPKSDLVNCEHTWPKSRFEGGNYEVKVSDLHHLFPSDHNANSVRGNHLFAETLGDAPTIGCDLSVIGIPEHGAQPQTFEPPVYHKGNVARALFYFSARYGLDIDDDQEAYLRLWNDLDPVDEFEYMRNERIMQLQGNRNPFIDYPGLVSRINNF